MAHITASPNADMGWWLPVYEHILRDFGFERDADERAARLLCTLVSEANNRAPIERLKELIEKRRTLVCGKAPRLASDLKRAKEGGVLDGSVLIAADGATSVLLSLKMVPHIIVSDLDGNMCDIIAASKMGSLVVVHAHGDNIPLLSEYVPRLKSVIPTTQSMPFDEVYNFGGFTDGDRCVFLAGAFGASKVVLLGFDFYDASKGPIKRKKLMWARRLILGFEGAQLEMLK